MQAPGELIIKAATKVIIYLQIKRSLSFHSDKSLDVFRDIRLRRKDGEEKFVSVVEDEKRRYAAKNLKMLKWDS